MKFSDVILAVAIMTAIFVLVYTVLGFALIPSMDSYLGQSIGGAVSMLVAGLVAGFVFAGSIQESRMKAIGKIVVLFATVELFVMTIFYSANSSYSGYSQETLQGMYSTGGWTTTDWFVYEQLALFVSGAVHVALALVLGFIGLYVGSMLRKPKRA